MSDSWRVEYSYQGSVMGYVLQLWGKPAVSPEFQSNPEDFAEALDELAEGFRREVDEAMSRLNDAEWRLNTLVAERAEIIQLAKALSS